MKTVFPRRIHIFLALLVLMGCASDTKHMRLYSGPERPDHEIARLIIVESLEVSTINGEGIPTVMRISNWRRATPTVWSTGRP